jgi:Zn-dependent peptidase ImmA (M78 family)
MTDQLEVPPITLPRLTGIDPSDAAFHARAALGLSPDGPIPHLIHAAERAGVLVIALPIGLAKRDAYSVWVGDETLRPVVVIVNDVPGDRLRFSVAHELGHLVMHQARPAHVTEIEAQAGEFAAALLMPEEGIRADLEPPITLTMLARLKPKWGVAIQTLVRRARSLDVISDRQYRYLFEQIARKGWRKQEPANLSVPVERPRAVRKIVEVLYGDPPDFARVASDMRLHPHQVRQILRAHADRSQLPPEGAVGEPRILPFPKPSVLSR